MNATALIEEYRTLGTAKLDPKRRSSLGQFMTPASIACYMASLFKMRSEMRVLDAGSGTGSLSIAFVEKAFKKKNVKVNLSAWEIEPMLRGLLTIALGK